MAATYNTAQTPTTFTATAQSTPWAPGNFTPAAGSDRMAIVTVGYGFPSGTVVTTAVTLGGQAMTQVGTGASDSTWVSTTAWRLNEAGIAAMSGAALSIVFTGDGGSSANLAAAVCFTLTDTAGTTSSPQTGSGTGTTAAPGTAVTSTADGLVIAVLMSDDEGGPTVSAPGADDGGTLKSAVVGGDSIAAAQYRAGTGGSVTPAWTQASTGWAVVAFNVNASAGAGETITVDKWFSRPADVIRRKRGMVPSGTIGIKV